MGLALINGVATNNVLLCFLLTEGLFGYWRQPTFIFPEVPGRTFFPNLSQVINYFCSGPISADPICPQPKPKHENSWSSLARLALT